MRLWPIAAISASFVFVIAGCGASGSHAVVFDAAAYEDSATGPGTGPVGSDDGSTPQDGGTISQGDAGKPPSTCVPKTCAEIPANCGPQGDGCGGLIDGGCGTCLDHATCGGGGTPNQCGGSCTPKTCSDQSIFCGPAGDGCGGTLNCNPNDAGGCPDGGVCGGGGLFTCGPSVPDDAGAVDASFVCVPITTCAVGQCGPTNNGCGGSLTCPGCDDGGTCGYPTPFFCGYPPDGGIDGGLCVPKTCSSQSLSCGLAGDGCGNIINCWPDAGPGTDGGSCPGGAICGATDAGQCGAPPIADAAVDSCVPSKTCSGQGFNCGFTDNGCGALLDCWPDDGGGDGGSSCSGFNTCGGGGASNVCGGSSAPADGGSLCVSQSCAAQHISCGAAGDGCGNTLNCYADGGASCGVGETCTAVDDGGAVACVSTSVACTKTTCAAQHIACGTAGDGCGGTLNCNPGDAGSCGDGGLCETVDSGMVECVFPAAGCVPNTCTSPVFYNCGPVGDGCGGLLNCNADDAGCPSPEYCGGGGPSLCGLGYTTPDGGTYVTCSSTPTSISGIVYAATNPADFNAAVTPDPIAGAYVWVPNDGVLPPILPEHSCGQCGTPPTALAITQTGPDGRFTLPNVPLTSVVGDAGTVPIIVQVGRWARLTTISVNKCTENTTPSYDAGVTNYLRLPRTGAEGNLPWFAFDTGSVDSLECVLLKMGIDSTMFAKPATVLADMDASVASKSVDGGTRVAIYTSPDQTPDHLTETNVGGAFAPGGTNTPATSLYGDAATMAKFDAVLFPCVGGEIDKNFTAQKNVVDYANNGGRVFATHYSYVWLMDDYPNAEDAGVTPTDYAWGCTTDSDYYYWDNAGGGSEKLSTTDTPCSTVGHTVGTWDLNQASWDSETAYIDPSTGDGRTFAQWMVDLDAATQGGTSGIDGSVGTDSTISFTILNPRWDLDSVNAAAEQLVYVDTGSGGGNSVQQMTFNTPVSVDGGGQCGKVVYGDFHVVNSGNSYGQVFPVECTADASSTVLGNLKPMTAQERALEFMIFDLQSCLPVGEPDGGCALQSCVPGTCGPESNGCGGSITCECGDGSVCGAGGSPVLCGPACVPRGCSFYGADTCGTQSDGCGDTIVCPGCDGGMTCGGGGVAGQCGSCAPKGCDAYPTGTCGEQANGCGGLTANCNTCADAGPGATCGGGGVVDVCGVPDAGVCTALTCVGSYSGMCGEQSNGCGGIVSCGGCDGGATCGGGGVASVCGVPDAGGCSVKDCSAYPTGTCGQQSDGCGGLTVNCGTCDDAGVGASCGGSGTPGVCGTGACQPLTCADQGITCGPAGDGCGNTIASCGSCATGQTCGGGGTTGVCGGCTKLTCSSPGIGCGINGDGCGGSLDCTCPSGETCGGGGTAGVCGSETCTSATCASLSLACGYASDGCGNLLSCGTCSGGASCVNGQCIAAPPQ